MKISRLHKFFAAGLLLAAACACLWAALAPRPREFSDPAEFQAWAMSHGLRVAPDWPEETRLAARAFTDRPGLDFTAVVFNSPPPGVVVVVAARHALPREGGRVWGEVFVWGDNKLLDRLHSLRLGDHK